jgi:hypothetical protein
MSAKLNHLTKRKEKEMIRNASKVNLIPFKNLNKKMLILIAIVSLLISSTPAFSQAPKTAPIIIGPNNTFYSSPSSIEEVNSLANTAASTAKQLKVVDAQIKDVNVRGEALAAQIRIHNQIWPNGCIYPPDNPRFCDGWIAEGNQMNGKMQVLKAEYNTLIGTRGGLQSTYSVTVARLKLSEFLENRLAPWVNRVVKCSKIESEFAARECLAEAWEVHP